MSVENRTHKKYLERLVFHLDKIGETREKIEWIMSEASWFKEGSVDLHKLCDLLIKYYSCKIGIPIELKGSENKLNKAISQLKSGKEFLENSFGLEVPYGKIVIYGQSRKYHFFTYDFEKGKFRD